MNCLLSSLSTSYQELSSMVFALITLDWYCILGLSSFTLYISWMYYSKYVSSYYFLLFFLGEYSIALARAKNKHTFRHYTLYPISKSSLAAQNEKENEANSKGVWAKPIFDNPIHYTHVPSFFYSLTSSLFTTPNSLFLRHKRAVRAKENGGSQSPFFIGPFL